MNNTNICPVIYNNPNNIYNKINNSLTFYQKETLKHIREFFPIFIPAHKRAKTLKYILGNDDLIANLTTAIMFADMTYDNSKGSKNNWRSHNCRWVLNKTFATNKNRMMNITDWSHIPSNNKVSYDKESFDIIEAKIDALSQKRKDIMKLYYYDNLNEAQIAKRFSISQPRVSQILADIKKKLNNDR